MCEFGLMGLRPLEKALSTRVKTDFIMHAINIDAKQC